MQSSKLNETKIDDFSVISSLILISKVKSSDLK